MDPLFDSIVIVSADRERKYVFVLFVFFLLTAEELFLRVTSFH